MMKMVTVVYAKQLEGIIDAMIDAQDEAADILDCCRDAVRASLEERGREIPEKIKRLDFYRL